MRHVAAATVTLAAALAGVAAYGSGLDRLSSSDPQVAARVPELFRSQAWRGMAKQALGRRRVDAEAAEAAVLADPADPAAVSLLGIARLTAGDPARADAAFRVSGRLGWRDLPTQLYWLSIADAVGDHAVAAERADAILRQNVTWLERPQFLAQLEATPAGRRAVAVRLASRPPWFGEYWSRTFTLPPDRLAQRAAVLDAPALRRTLIRCGEVRGLAMRLGEIGNRDEGRIILDRYCAGGRHGLVDGGFERAQLHASAPGGWKFAGMGGLGLRLTDGRWGRQLTVASTLPYRVVFATQALQLAPGPYRISWTADDAAGAPSRRIAVRLACPSGAGEFRTLPPMMVEVGAACSSPTLELAILPGSGAVAVDDVVVEPLD